MVDNVFEESYILPLACGAQLGVRRLFSRQHTPPLFLLHSLFESSADLGLKPGGLAHTLALKGFDVWMPDLRGHGRSWPPVNECHGNDKLRALDDWVGLDLPRLMAFVEEKKGKRLHLFAGHGFGGQLLLQALDQQKRMDEVHGLLMLASSRRMNTDASVSGKWVNKRLAWQKKRKGYFVGEKLVFANSDEFTQAWDLAVNWTNDDQLFSGLQCMPDSLYIALEGAVMWGEPEAVNHMMREVPAHDGCQITLTDKSMRASSKENRKTLHHGGWLQSINDDLAAMIAGWLGQRAV